VDLHFDQRVAQGVLDTVVEQAILGPGGDSRNAALAHAADLEAGQPWARLDQATIEEVDKLALASEAKARIKSEVSEGNIVIGPGKPTVVRRDNMAAWWRVDPRTGLTLGVDASGRGSEAVEESVLDNFTNGAVVCAVIGLGQGMATNHVSLLRYTECLATAAMGAPHGINAIYGHAALNLAVATFEMIESASGGGHGE
jgi:hypothetical protein